MKTELINSGTAGFDYLVTYDDFGNTYSITPVYHYQTNFTATTTSFDWHPPGSDSSNEVVNALSGLCPPITSKTACPLGGTKDCSFIHPDLTVWQAVVHLNDGHRWSREAIADWLETIDVDLTIKKGAA